MLGMCVVVILLLRIGNTIFNREELLGRVIDQMNFSGIFRKIGRYIVAVDANGTPARNLIEWYTRAIPFSLGKLKVSAGIVVSVFVFVFVAGFAVGLLPQYRLPLPTDLANASQSIATVFDEYITSEIQQQAVMAVVWQNGRVLLAATILAFFTFGVMALVINPLVYFILGYLFSQLMLAGLDLTLFFAAFVPHGIVEIPVIVLATALAFRLGSIVTRPPNNATVGHAWITALGDTIKLGVGLVIPGLIVAALLEVYVTIPILMAVAGR
jgi:stage II sporulation protein M